MNNELVHLSPLSGGTLNSFDIEGLFPHVPIRATVQRMEEILKEVEVPFSTASDFLKLLQCCLYQNVCKFKQDVYRFPTDIGTPIKSPLDSLISDVFMNMLRNKIFNSNHHVLPYIALCGQGQKKRPPTVPYFNNSLYSSIEFTIEIGGDKINFLDLEIATAITGGMFQFGIYREPTSTDITIHGGCS